MMTADWMFAGVLGKLVMPEWNAPLQVTIETQTKYPELFIQFVVDVIEDSKQVVSSASKPGEYVLVELLKETTITLSNVVIDVPVEGDTVN